MIQGKLVLRGPPLCPTDGTSELEEALIRSCKELEDATSELDDSIAMVSNYQFITAMSKFLTDAEEFQTSVAAKLLKTQTDSSQSMGAHETSDGVTFGDEAAVNDLHDALSQSESFSLSPGALIQIKGRVMKGLGAAIEPNITDSPDEGMSPLFTGPWYFC